MSHDPRPDHDTRSRLIASAGELFADRGFDSVTVRDICAHAEANVAAVNYHFGDKAGLYREVLETAMGAMEQLTAYQIAQGQGLAPEARLKSYVHILIELTTSTGMPWLRRLLQREMAAPSPNLDRLLDRGLRPRVAYLSSIVADLLGTTPDDPRVFFCVASVHGQCFMAGQWTVAQRISPVPLTKATMVEYADHVTRFSLAGLRTMALAGAGGSRGAPHGRGGGPPRRGPGGRRGPLR